MQLIRIPSSMPIRGLYPSRLRAFSPLQNLVLHASRTLPRLSVVGVPVTQVTTSAMYPTKEARDTGMCISNNGK